MRLTDERINRIREQLSSVNGAQWVTAGDGFVLDGNNWETGGYFVAKCEREIDGDFIANAGEYVRLLLCEVEALKKELAIAKWKTEQVAKSKDNTIRKLRGTK
jgi:hypothetical protein